MKMKELLWLVGLGRPAPRRYGHEVRSFRLPTDGEVEYAQWLHPSERPKEIRQDVVDGIAQCSINAKINRTFEETLRHIVRQVIPFAQNKATAVHDA